MVYKLQINFCTIYIVLNLQFSSFLSLWDVIDFSTHYRCFIKKTFTWIVNREVGQIWIESGLVAITRTG